MFWQEATVGDEIGFHRRCSNRLQQNVQKQDATGRVVVKCDKKEVIPQEVQLQEAMRIAAEECNRRMHEANVNATLKPDATF